LNDLSNLTIYQNAGLQVISLSGITSGSASENQVLTVTAATSNPNLIAKPVVNYTSPQSTGTLTFKPSAMLTGASVITVTVNDGGATNNVIVKKFTVTVVAPPNPATPKFSKPLASLSAVVGQTITLNVAVTGKAPFKYQWKFNGVNLPGATSSSLTLKNVTASRAGAYSVTVSNAAGTTNSGAAFLAVNAMAPARVPVLQAQAQAQARSLSVPAATLTPMKRADGQFAFAVAGVAGRQYVVQASVDLKNWADVQTNTAPFTFTDANAGSFKQRFYRTYSVP
jgi:hypothetical protein